MSYGLDAYNDSRPPSKKAIAKENASMLLRQQNFKLAAEYVAVAFSHIDAVQRVVLFGSVAQPLVEEIPRFRRFRIHKVPILHECSDVDVAVWLNDLSCLKTLQKARGNAVNYLQALRNVGVAHHQVDVFVIDAVTGKYIGNLCLFGNCPKGKQDCYVAGCGEPAFLQVYEKFKLKKDALTAEKSVVLFDRGQEDDPIPLPTENI
jgi:hypothetical protein